MTSLQRSATLLILATIISVCNYGGTVKEWGSAAWFGVILSGATTLHAGLSKSPRDASISDSQSQQLNRRRKKR